MAFASAFKAASELGIGQVLQGLRVVQSFWELLYFAIVTVSTLGYGDSCPVGPMACFLSCAGVIEFWLFFALAVFVIQECVKQPASMPSPGPPAGVRPLRSASPPTRGGPVGGGSGKGGP
ncbi:MAG: ion channel [Planctomycetota bacterium]